jgi:hypothetical protein
VLAQGFIKCEFVMAHQFTVFILQKQDILEETQIFFATSGLRNRETEIIFYKRKNNRSTENHIQDLCVD